MNGRKHSAFKAVLPAAVAIGLLCLSPDGFSAPAADAAGSVPKELAHLQERQEMLNQRMKERIAKVERDYPVLVERNKKAFEKIKESQTPMAKSLDEFKEGDVQAAYQSQADFFSQMAGVFVEGINFLKESDKEKTPPIGTFLKKEGDQVRFPREKKMSLGKKPFYESDNFENADLVTHAVKEKVAERAEEQSYMEAMEHQLQKAFPSRPESEKIQKTQGAKPDGAEARAREGSDLKSNIKEKTERGKTEDGGYRSGAGGDSHDKGDGMREQEKDLKDSISEGEEGAQAQAGEGLEKMKRELEGMALLSSGAAAGNGAGSGAGEGQAGSSSGNEGSRVSSGPESLTGGGPQLEARAGTSEAAAGKSSSTGAGEGSSGAGSDTQNGGQAGNQAQPGHEPGALSSRTEAAASGVSSGASGGSEGLSEGTAKNSGNAGGGIPPASSAGTSGEAQAAGLASGASAGEGPASMGAGRIGASAGKQESEGPLARTPQTEGRSAGSDLPIPGQSGMGQGLAAVGSGFGTGAGGLQKNDRSGNAPILFSSGLGGREQNRSDMEAAGGASPDSKSGEGLASGNGSSQQKGSAQAGDGISAGQSGTGEGYALSKGAFQSGGTGNGQGNAGNPAGSGGGGAPAAAGAGNTVASTAETDAAQAGAGSAFSESKAHAVSRGTSGSGFAESRAGSDKSAAAGLASSSGRQENHSLSGGGLDGTQREGASTLSGMGRMSSALSGAGGSDQKGEGPDKNGTGSGDLETKRENSGIGRNDEKYTEGKGTGAGSQQTGLLSGRAINLSKEKVPSAARSAGGSVEERSGEASRGAARKADQNTAGQSGASPQSDTAEAREAAMASSLKSLENKASSSGSDTGSGGAAVSDSKSQVTAGNPVQTSPAPHGPASPAAAKDKALISGQNSGALPGTAEGDGASPAAAIAGSGTGAGGFQSADQTAFQQKSQAAGPSAGGSSSGSGGAATGSGGAAEALKQTSSENRNTGSGGNAGAGSAASFDHGAGSNASSSGNQSENRKETRNPESGRISGTVNASEPPPSAPENTSQTQKSLTNTALKADAGNAQNPALASQGTANESLDHERQLTENPETDTVEDVMDETDIMTAIRAWILQERFLLLELKRFKPVRQPNRQNPPWEYYVMRQKQMISKLKQIRRRIEFLGDKDEFFIELRHLSTIANRFLELLNRGEYTDYAAAGKAYDSLILEIESVNPSPRKESPGHLPQQSSDSQETPDMYRPVIARYFKSLSEG